MSEEVKRKCFTLFGNLKFRKDINTGGMGLGLASSQHICKALKGKLYLENSAENFGTTIRFIIEVKIGEAFSQET